MWELIKKLAPIALAVSVLIVWALMMLFGPPSQEAQNDPYPPPPEPTLVETTHETTRPTREETNQWQVEETILPKTGGSRQ